MTKFVLFPNLTGSDQLLPIDGRWCRFRIYHEVCHHILNSKRNFPHKAEAMKAAVQVCSGSVTNPNVMWEFSVE